MQGIKRGIIEMVDALAITKADDDMQARAERARAEYRAALHLFPAPADGWVPPVVTCSAFTGAGISAIRELVVAHRTHMEGSGHFALRRRQQALAWMHELVDTGLDAAFRSHPGVAGALPPPRGCRGRGPDDAGCRGP